jgi:two-component system, chemotaxis family, sensor kinase CheA
VDTEALKKSLMSRFVEVSRDRLQSIQLGVIDLEKLATGGSTESIERELHTMKGEARMLGLGAVGQLAHACEDVLKAWKDKKVETQAAADHLLHACDALTDLLDDLEAAKEGTVASQAMVDTLARVSGMPAPPLKPRPSAPHPRPSMARTAPRPQPPPPLPPLPTAASSAPRPPPSAPPPPSSAPEPPPTADGAIRASDDPVERRSTQDRSIRVGVEILDHLGLLAGDLLVESARAQLRTDELQGLFQRFSRLGDHFLKARAGGEGAAAHAQLERLETDLHLLRDDAFRFVRHHGDGLTSLHGNLSQLADHVAEARLVPLSTVFEAFPRALRDIAQSQGKKVDLHVDNAGLGVDRSMLADVRDALIHLLRNAIDHGIEAPDYREALGKPPQGQVAIRVRADGDMLALEVEDDGRGIDPERLRQAAVQKKLLTPHQAQTIGERELMDFIFKSGFSTREEVSELSGRGVGMDVVKRKVEVLGGSVSVSSRVGRGTTISLRLPQSLALMRVLLVRLGDDVYGMPAADVEAVARFKVEDRSEVMGTLTARHRDRPIALVALGPLLGLNGGPRHDRPPSVVVRHGNDKAALVVDGFVDEREVAVKPCGGEFLKGAPFIAGTAALEDGRIAVLLHVPDIMAEVRRVSRPVAEQPTTKRLKVLLVDDSPIARATESALVRALGHLVEEAQDGEDAWARVLDQPYDLILTDVQMPKLDGFALTRRLKNHPDFGRLPVIILSSLASPEDKRRGIDAGADAYLIKGELGVESLALAIDRLT